VNNSPISNPPVPVRVTVTISHAGGQLTVCVEQRMDFRGRPVQSMSQVWKEACADVNPYVRRHDTVVA
jgi:hypothetical protein